MWVEDYCFVCEKVCATGTIYCSEACREEDKRRSQASRLSVDGLDHQVLLRLYGSNSQLHDFFRDQNHVEDLGATLDERESRHHSLPNTSRFYSQLSESLNNSNSNYAFSSMQSQRRSSVIQVRMTPDYSYNTSDALYYSPLSAYSNFNGNGVNSTTDSFADAKSPTNNQYIIPRSISSMSPNKLNQQQPSQYQYRSTSSTLRSNVTTLLNQSNVAPANSSINAVAQPVNRSSLTPVLSI
ncbi:hypothetical protein V1511DRAFT_490359 [Dipodascopsis uninucleata]